MSKVLDTLKNFSKKELQSFSLYIHSPFFCQHLETIRLFDFIIPYHPTFDLDVYSAFNAAFHQGQLSRSRFNVLSSYLLQQAHGYMATTQLRADPLAQQLLLIDRLRQKEFFKEAQKQLDVAWNMWQKEVQLDSSNFTQLLQLQELQLDLTISVGMWRNDVPLQDYFQALDQHGLGFGMKYMLPAWTVNQVYEIEFPEQRWQSLVKLFEAFPRPLSPLISMYYHLICLLQGKEESEHYPVLSSLLEQHTDRMSKVELMNIYGYLQNFLTRKHRMGKEEAVGQLFQVYQKLNQYQLIFGRGDFTEHLIRNITIIGCRLGELQWTQSFLETHRQKIEVAMGGNVFSYSQAYLDFYQGNYSYALRHLQNLKFTDPFYRTGHQCLILRIYYELGDWESLESLSGTFRRYLNRTSALSDARKDFNRNFISVLHQLAQAKENGVTPDRLAKIERMMRPPMTMSDPTWLREKLNELL